MIIKAIGTMFVITVVILHIHLEWWEILLLTSGLFWVAA